jgi:hypothetical protein
LNQKKGPKTKTDSHKGMNIANGQPGMLKIGKKQLLQPQALQVQVANY